MVNAEQQGKNNESLGLAGQNSETLTDVLASSFEAEPPVTRLEVIREHFETVYDAVIEDPFPRPYQKDAFAGFRAALDYYVDQEDQTVRAALFHSMGSGKTYTTAKILQMCGVGKELEGKRVRALWVAPERHILDNIIGENDDSQVRGLALAAPEITAQQWSGRQPERIDADVTIMTTQALVREWVRYNNGESTHVPFDDLDIIAFDEPDALLGDATAACIEALQPGRITLATTGTPKQKDGTTIFKWWPDLIGQMDMREAIELHDILGNGRSLNLLTMSTGGQIEGKIAPDGSLSDREMERILLRKNIYEFAVEIAKQYVEAGLTTAFFTPRGAESLFARTLAEELNRTTVFEGTDEERSVRAAAIGRFDRAGSLATIQDFNQGAYDVIVSARLGEVGWDPPNLNVVVCLAQTESERTALQRIGRLMHNSEEGSPLIAVFVHYDIVDPTSCVRARQVTPQSLFGLRGGRGSLYYHPSKATPDPDSYDEVRDFRRKHEEEASTHEQESEDEGPLTLSDLAAYELPEHIQDLLAKQRKKYPAKHLGTISLRPVAEHYEAEGEIMIADLAKYSGMDKEYLIRILLAEKQRVRSRIIFGERVEFCTTEGVDRLDEVIATQRHFSRRRIAEALIADFKVVNALMTRNFKDEPFSELYDRELGATAARKQRQYDAELLPQVGALLAKQPRSIQSNEVAIREIAGHISGDFSNHFITTFIEGQLGRQPVQRNIPGGQGKHTCFEMTQAEKERIIQKLDAIKEYVDDGSHLTLGTVSERLRSYAPTTTAELQELLTDTKYGKLLVRSGFLNMYVTTEDAPAVIELAHDAFLAKHSQPQQQNVAPAAAPAVDEKLGEPRVTLAKVADEIGVAVPAIVRHLKRTGGHTQLSSSNSTSDLLRSIPVSTATELAGHFADIPEAPSGNTYRRFRPAKILVAMGMANIMTVEDVYALVDKHAISIEQFRVPTKSSKATVHDHITTHSLALLRAAIAGKKKSDTPIATEQPEPQSVPAPPKKTIADYPILTSSETPMGPVFVAKVLGVTSSGLRNFLERKGVERPLSEDTHGRAVPVEAIPLLIDHFINTPDLPRGEKAGYKIIRPTTLLRSLGAADILAPHDVQQAADQAGIAIHTFRTTDSSGKKAVNEYVLAAEFPKLQAAVKEKILEKPVDAPVAKRPPANDHTVTQLSHDFGLPEEYVQEIALFVSGRRKDFDYQQLAKAIHEGIQGVAAEHQKANIYRTPTGAAVLSRIVLNAEPDIRQAILGDFTARYSSNSTRAREQNQPTEAPGAAMQSLSWATLHQAAVRVGVMDDQLRKIIAECNPESHDFRRVSDGGSGNFHLSPALQLRCMDFINARRNGER